LRSARLRPHLVLRASPNKGGPSSRDKGACSLIPSFALRYRVITMLHIVVLITTGYRTEKPIVSIFKEPSRMSRFLSGDH
jgi:hypothetical protein